jgi:pseudouridine synthase
MKHSPGSNDARLCTADRLPIPTRICLPLCFSSSIHTTQDYLADFTSEHRPSGRLSAVGRLDKETTGLLLLTDDGHLSERVLRPGGCVKVYEATVKLRSPAKCEESALRLLREGIELADGFARADSAEVVAEWQEVPDCSRFSQGPRNAKRAAKVQARQAAAAAGESAGRVMRGQQEETGRGEATCDDMPALLGSTAAVSPAAAAGGPRTHSAPSAAAASPSATAVTALPPFNVYVVRLGMRVGRNRIVRRLLAAVGLPCFELKRTCIGPLVLDGIERATSAAGSDGNAARPAGAPRTVELAPVALHHLGLEAPGAACRLTAEQEQALRASLGE